MTISPWLTFEKIKEYENRIETLELTQSASPLTANAFFYVNPTSGSNNSGAGLGPGADAYRTLEFALFDIATLYDPNGFDITVYLEDGVHSIGGTNNITIPNFDSFNTRSCVVSIENLNGQSDATLQFNFTAARNAIEIDDVYVRYCIKNTTIEAGTNVTSLIRVFNNSILRLEDITFKGTVSESILFCTSSGDITLAGTITIEEVTASEFLFCSKNAGYTGVIGLTFDFPASTVSSFSTAFVSTLGSGADLSFTNGFSVTGSGDPMGSRYIISALTGVQSPADPVALLDTFPGDSPGTILPFTTLRTEGPYADDTAAAGGGIEIGQQYYTPGGNVQVRIS